MLKIDKIVCKTPRQDVVYLVTMDGYTHSHGTELYAVGVYSTEAAAKKKAFAIEKKGGFPQITTLTVDNSLPIKGDLLQGLMTEAYIGGYVE